VSSSLNHPPYVFCPLLLGFAENKKRQSITATVHRGTDPQFTGALGYLPAL
jgi:hypothetical protein